MNRNLRKHLYTRMDDNQGDRAYAELVGEDPEIIIRLAQIDSLYKSILNPITPTADDPSAFIEPESPPTA